MAVMITGGTGFLGSALAEHLVRDKGLDDVVLYDRFPRPEAVAALGDAVTIVPGDVLELQELVTAIQRHGVDRIAHLGFAVGKPDPERMLPYLRAQCIGTSTVFEAARLCGIKRVANASSVAVYGGRPTDTPATEDDPPHPDGIYGALKLTSEQVAAVYNEGHGMEILSLRIAATFGYGRLGRRAILSGHGLTQDSLYFMGLPEIALLGGSVAMPPDDALSDFLYMLDLAEAFWVALTAPRPEHSVFNVRAEQRPVGDMTRHLRKLAPDADVTISGEPLRLTRLVDNARIVAELGFEPRYTVEAGLDDHLDRLRRAGALEPAA